MWLLTIRDLQYRLRRFTVVAAAMGLVFVLLYLMTGLVEQFRQEPALTADAVGATSWVLPPGVSGPFTSSATLAAEEQELVRALGDVDEMVVARASIDENEEVIVIGHELDGVGEPTPVDGRAALRTGEVVVDRAAGHSVGDTVLIGDRSFVVVGRSVDTTLLAGIPVVFMPIADARTALFGGRELVSALVSADEIGPVEGLPVRSAAEVADDARGPLESAISSINLIRGLLWIVAAIVLGGVIYLTTLEAERDVAVLKAIGAGHARLAAGSTSQAIVVALAAVALATVLQAFIAPVFPLKVRVPGVAYWQIPLMAVVVTLVAVQAGLRRVRRTDPALAFEGTR